MSLRPMPYQKEGVYAIRDFGGRALLADEMGLGKTLQALWYMQKSKSYPAIIICPASLKLNWKREAAKLGIDCEVAYGMKGWKGFNFSKCQVLIINYDIVNAWTPALMAHYKPELMILDECHYVQSRTNKRSRAVRTLSRTVPKIIGISGTPLTNRPSELWSILNMILPKDFPTFQRYAARYCKPKMTPWGWDYSGAQNLKELHHILKTKCMIRRLKKDVLTELPEKAINVVVLELDNFQEYQRAADDFIGWLREQDPKKLRKALKALAISRLNYLKQLAAELKQRPLLAYLDDALEESGEKIVVSCCHHKMIDAIMDHFGSKAVKIDGRTPQDKRQEIVDRFQTDPEITVFVGQLQAAGVGLTLTASSKVFFAECGWKPGDHQQMADRVHRIGQKSHCTATYLVASGTIEESFVELLQSKTEVLTKVLEGSDDIGGNDIFDQLMRMIGIK